MKLTGTVEEKLLQIERALTQLDRRAGGVQQVITPPSPVSIYRETEGNDLDRGGNGHHSEDREDSFRSRG